MSLPRARYRLRLPRHTSPCRGVSRTKVLFRRERLRRCIGANPQRASQTEDHRPAPGHAVRRVAARRRLPGLRLELPHRSVARARDLVVAVSAATPTASLLGQLEAHDELLAAHSSSLRLVTTVADLDAEDPRTGVLPHSEGFHLPGIERDTLDSLWAERSLRSLALTWNYETDYGYSCYDDGAAPPQAGRPASSSARWQTSPILLDLAHLNEGGFYDSLDLYAPPVLVTHSFCRAIGGPPARPGRRPAASARRPRRARRPGVRSRLPRPGIGRRGAAPHRPHRVAGGRGRRLHRQRLGRGRDGRAGRPRGPRRAARRRRPLASARASPSSSRSRTPTTS